MTTTPPPTSCSPPPTSGDGRPRGRLAVSTPSPPRTSRPLAPSSTSECRAPTARSSSTSTAAPRCSAPSRPPPSSSSLASARRASSSGRQPGRRQGAAEAHRRHHRASSPTLAGEGLERDRRPNLPRASSPGCATRARAASRPWAGSSVSASAARKPSAAKTMIDSSSAACDTVAVRAQRRRLEVAVAALKRHDQRLGDLQRQRCGCTGKVFVTFNDTAAARACLDAPASDERRVLRGRRLLRRVPDGGAQASAVGESGRAVARAVGAAVPLIVHSPRDHHSWLVAHRDHADRQAVSGIGAALRERHDIGVGPTSARGWRWATPPSTRRDRRRRARATLRATALYSTRARWRARRRAPPTSGRASPACSVSTALMIIGHVFIFIRRRSSRTLWRCTSTTFEGALRLPQAHLLPVLQRHPQRRRLHLALPIGRPRVARRRLRPHHQRPRVRDLCDQPRHRPFRPDVLIRRLPFAPRAKTQYAMNLSTRSTPTSRSPSACSSKAKVIILAFCLSIGQPGAVARSSAFTAKSAHLVDK